MSREIVPLILLNLSLPAISGLDVLQHLKSSAAIKRIPVVILSSTKHDSDVNACFNLSANSYILKPIDLHLYQNMVTNVALYWLRLNEFTHSSEYAQEVFV